MSNTIKKRSLLNKLQKHYHIFGKRTLKKGFRLLASSTDDAPFNKQNLLLKKTLENNLTNKEKNLH